MKKKIACLIYGEKLHYLDHLAPLCYFFKIPLITNSLEISELAKKYYPNIEVLYIDSTKIHLYLTQHFDKIISCITKKHFDFDFKFHQDLLKKEIKTIWCPHGNSDKGKTCYFFETLKNEREVIVYGNKMIDLLNEKRVLHTIKSYTSLGNYRLLYHHQFRSLHKRMMLEKLNSFQNRNNKIILYTPTWEDAEKSSSFSQNIDNVLDSLPKKYNLIVKLHPNLLIQKNLQIETLKSKYQRENILFLENFPLIYPLLEMINIYLGDFSSIGYDFLFFNKPMFFLKSENEKLSSNLYQCGHLIENENVYETIDKFFHEDKRYSHKREKLYHYTFEKNINLKKIKTSLHK